MDKSSLHKYEVKTLCPRLLIAASYLLTTMPVKIVFSRDSRWVMCKLSSQEIGLAM